MFSTRDGPVHYGDAEGFLRRIRTARPGSGQATFSQDRQFLTGNTPRMPQTRISCFWEAPDLGHETRAAVSLHGHTNRSKESLRFIPELARKSRLLDVLQKQCRKARIPVDFARAYWTPPLTPRLAFETEQRQIEKGLGLKSMVSLTDHDNIEAALELRNDPDLLDIPISVEWSVPFQGAVFHLGVHNLPGSRANRLTREMAAYTANPGQERLLELLAEFHDHPEMLVVFNHPLWAQSSLGVRRDGYVLERFLSRTVGFLHAFEINGTRSNPENRRVRELARAWNRPLVAGGDRHGCTASSALNLTGAESFPQFVNEIRREQRSHILLMPEYTRPMCVRNGRTLLDVIRPYPEYPDGSRRWDDRVFHPDDSGLAYRPISALWKRPPAFMEQIFACLRMGESATVQRAMRWAFNWVEMDAIRMDGASPAAAPEAIS
jgi:hypothetical protein